MRLKGDKWCYHDHDVFFFFKRLIRYCKGKSKCIHISLVKVTNIGLAYNRCINRKYHEVLGIWMAGIAKTLIVLLLKSFCRRQNPRFAMFCYLKKFSSSFQYLTFFELSQSFAVQMRPSPFHAAYVFAILPPNSAEVFYSECQLLKSASPLSKC